MDFLAQRFGWFRPVEVVNSYAQTPCAPSRPVTPPVLDPLPNAVDLSHEAQIKRYLQSGDPIKVAIGEHSREAFFGQEAAKALQRMRHTSQSMRVGPMLGALLRLMTAEEKRVGSLDKSALFAPQGEATRLCKTLLRHLSHERCNAALFLTDARVRAVLERTVDVAAETREALKWTVFSALIYERSAEKPILRWAMRGLGCDRPELTRANFAHYAAETISTDSCVFLDRALSDAEIAWSQGDVRRALNCLLTVASLRAISDEGARRVMETTNLPRFLRGRALARTILKDRTTTLRNLKARETSLRSVSSEEDIVKEREQRVRQILSLTDVRCFRITGSCAGWSAIFPLLNNVDHEPPGSQLDNDDLAALESLSYYAPLAWRQEKNIGPSATKFLRAYVRLMTDCGFNPSSLKDAKYAMEWEAPLPYVEDDPSDPLDSVRPDDRD